MASITDIQAEAQLIAEQLAIDALNPGAVTPASLEALQNELTQLANDVAGLVCYVSGTRIRTVDGPVAVEDLRLGDSVVTASGARRPIRWLGHRTIRIGEDEQADKAPVRIARDAFAPGKPKRDLFVSPGHAICVDLLGEVLIPAAALINGSTIRQEPMAEVTYWHVELDSHDIILAEDLAAESYIEMNNRGFFAESDVVEIGASPDAPVRTYADFCRPFHAEGALVEAVRSQLAARAERLGWRLEEQGLRDLHLEVDGVRVEPRLRGLVARFALPAGARDVWLVSRSGSPAAFEATRDRRTLGVCIAALAVNNGFGDTLDVPAEDPRLCDGFYGVEHHDHDRTVRWTSGRARLPAELWDGITDDFYLRVDLVASALPRFVAPVEAANDGYAPVALTA